MTDNKNQKRFNLPLKLRHKASVGNDFGVDCFIRATTYTGGC